MEQLQENIIQLLEELKSNIQRNLESNKINASGRTSKSLAVVAYDGGVKLVATQGEHAPLKTLEIGRPGGAVPRGFYGIIKQWSRDKGITFSTESERSTFAYFTANKIATEGTERHKNNVDVYSSEVVKTSQKIKDVIGATIKEKIKNNFA